MNIQPIKTEKDNQRALARIDELWGAEEGTPEGDELDILLTLVESFESKAYPIDAPDPIEAIKFRMEQSGLTNNDLTEILGQRSRVSEVLNRKRKLSLNMIRALHNKLNIPLSSLITDYQLAS